MLLSTAALDFQAISQSEVKIDLLNGHETLDKMSFRATLSVSSNPSRSEPWRNSCDETLFIGMCKAEGREGIFPWLIVRGNCTFHNLSTHM